MSAADAPVLEPAETVALVLRVDTGETTALHLECLETAARVVPSLLRPDPSGVWFARAEGPAAPGARCSRGQACERAPRRYMGW